MHRPSLARRLRRYSCYFLLTLPLLFVLGYLTPQSWSVFLPQDCSQAQFRVYVAGEAMHVNLVLPVRDSVTDWSQYLDLNQLGRKAGQNYRYLKFGWGDRGFYMETPSWSDVRLSNALRALFWPGNPTVLYVQGYDTLPQEAGVELRCMTLTAENYQRLVQALQASFQLQAGRPLRLKDGYGETSGFYAATGYYSVLRTCNTWAADILRAGGINTPVWSALASAVMLHARNGCPCASVSSAP